MSMNLSTRQCAFIGPANQKKLVSSTIAIIGLGALGSASAHLLTRMGVGKLILCDDDVVADHNLGRQHMYVAADIGKLKAEILTSRLLEINPNIIIEFHTSRITSENISCCDGATLLVDGTDNHATRRVIDTYCKQKSLSWVHGAAIEDKGTVVFFPPTLSYEVVYGGKNKDQHCSISGVIVTTTTAVATQQVQLALKFLIGEEIPKIMYHLNDLNWTQIKL